MMRFLRSAFVIARRDFTATVLSKTFIFFLLAPLFPAAMGGVFGGIGARVASQAQRPVVAVVAPRDEFQRLSAAREELAGALGDQSLVNIVGYTPEADLAIQQARLLASRNPPVRAVLSGTLEHPRLIGALGNDPAILGQVKLLLANARDGEADDSADLPVTVVRSSSGSLTAITFCRLG